MFEVIKGVDVDIESQIIAIIAECDLHSPVFDDPSRSVSQVPFLNCHLQKYN